MDREDRLARREAQRVALRRRRRRARVLVLGALAAIVAIVVAAAGGEGGQRAVRRTSTAPAAAPGPSARRSVRAVPVSTVGRPGTGRPTEAAVPILMYHVIAPPPPGGAVPGLYVPPAQFRAQMRALARAGWHAVTMDQLLAHWHRDAGLGEGKPIVLSFDNGYESQYTQARPVLDALGWPGVENIQLAGLPPSQGGLTRRQVRGLVADGWELDTQGIDHADLVAIGDEALRAQVAGARATVRRRYHVVADWFCYPSGHYDPRVVTAVRAAGYAGSTTVVPGWARRRSDPFRLPRLRVLGGTSPAALLAQIRTARSSGAPPASYGS